jgi:hypothetical protein
VLRLGWERQEAVPARFPGEPLGDTRVDQAGPLSYSVHAKPIHLTTPQISSVFLRDREPTMIQFHPWVAM